jgi:hypothetical protein
LKRTVLLTVLLSGLGAEARAGLIGPDFLIPGVSQPLFDSSVATALVETDLDLLAPSLRHDFWDDEPPSEPATDIDLGDAVPDEFTLTEKQGSGSHQVPEPPPASTLLLGLGLVGVASLWRKCPSALRRKIPVRRRRTRGRPLTALR